MGRCARRAKKVGRVVAKALKPAGLALIADTVGLVASTDWSSHDKRELAYQLAKARLKQAGIEAEQAAVRLGIEYSVNAMNASADALADIGAVDDLDIDEVLPETE